MSLPTKPAKPWWQSKTLWLNAAVLLLAAAEQQLDLLKQVLPLNFYTLVALLLPASNMVLRVITSQPLALGKPADAAEEQA